MKKFLIKIILVLLPVLLFVAGVNYFGDAANLFSAGYEEKIAKGLKSGYNVTNVANYDERILQKHIIDSVFCPDVVVLGSSRTMTINSSYFNNKTFVNNSVSGASLEDILAIYEIYEENGCTAKHIILGLDPWTLNANNGQLRWKSLQAEYNTIYSQLENKKQISGEITTPQSKYLQIISPSYFQASIKKLGSNNELVLTKKDSNTTFTRLADGAIVYDQKFRNSTQTEIDAAVNSYLNGDLYSIEKFDEISTELKRLLEKFLVLLKQKNIKVTIFLSPYHPKVYSFLSSRDKYKQALNSEKIYRELALKYKMELIGSFNPALLNMDDNYFFDGMHAKDKGIQKILNISTEK